MPRLYFTAVDKTDLAEKFEQDAPQMAYVKFDNGFLEQLAEENAEKHN